MTFYWKIQIGTFGQPNSTVQAFVSIDGGPYKEWINMQNLALQEDAVGKDYDTITLLTYMSGRDPNISAGPVSYAWYDELIVSTQPVAAPTTAPTAP